MKKLLFGYSKLVGWNIEAQKVKPTPSVAKRLSSRKEKSSKLVKLKASKLEVAKKFKGKRQELLKKWLNNNPGRKIEIHKMSPSYLALKEIGGNPLQKREAFVLLSLVEKYWSTDKAWELYKDCWSIKKGISYFFIKKLSDFFSKDEAGSKIGMYFGERIIAWTPEQSWKERVGRKPKVSGNIVKVDTDFGTNKITAWYKVRGWWKVNRNQKNKDSYEGGRHLVKDVLDKNKVRGDRWLGLYLFHGLTKAKTEFKIPKGQKRHNESHLSLDREKEIVNLLNRSEDVARNASKEKFRKEMLKWFKKQEPNRWVTLGQEQVNMMSFIYGKGCGNYMYRYDSIKKWVYILRIDGAVLESGWGQAGVIVAKDDKLGKKWNGYRKPEGMLKKWVLAKLTGDEVAKELAKYNVKSKTASKEDKETLTKGIVASLSIASVVKYSNLKRNYIDKLQKKLENYFIKKKKYDASKAHELASYRVTKLHNAIKKKISEDKPMVKVLTKYPDAKIKIEIDSNDKPTIKIVDRAPRMKYLKNKKVAKKEAIVGKVMSSKDVNTDLAGKIRGRMNPILAWILDAVFNIKKTVDTYMKSGKMTFKMKILLALSGGGAAVAGYKLRVGSKKLDQSSFDKLLKPKAKKKVLDKKAYFKQNVLLAYKGKRKKITIPKGKGIFPGRSMDVLLDRKRKTISQSDEKTTPKKKSVKPKGFNPLAGLLGGGKSKGDFMFKNKEIIITKKIPKGTILPKGTIIELA